MSIFPILTKDGEYVWMSSTERAPAPKSIPAPKSLIVRPKVVGYVMRQSPNDPGYCGTTYYDNGSCAYIVASPSDDRFEPMRDKIAKIITDPKYENVFLGHIKFVSSADDTVWHSIYFKYVECSQCGTAYCLPTDFYYRGESEVLYDAVCSACLSNSR